MKTLIFINVFLLADLVLAVFNNGHEGTGTAHGFLWASRKHETSDLSIKHYYIIKRFEE